jgi:hypothetical protein
VEPGRSTSLLCPSGRCQRGAVLLGIVGPDGTVGYLSQRITVDDTFVQRAEQGRAPEARFRFAEPCVAERCANWSAGTDPDDGRCGVIDQVVNSPHAAPEADRALPRCSIRARCRWFAQWRARACASCPMVVHTLES